MPRPAGKGGEDFLLGIPDVTGLNADGPVGGPDQTIQVGTPSTFSTGDKDFISSGVPSGRSGAIKITPAAQAAGRQGQGQSIAVNKQLGPAAGSGTGGRGVFSPEEKRGRQTQLPALFKRVNERGA